MRDKILVVDDDPAVLDAYRRSLRSRFRIDTAASGALALERVRDAGPYAVVVADMRMPGMDGVALLAELAKRAPDTVRIMLTGNPDQRTAVEAVNRGQVFRFLNKPCAAGQLAVALEDGIRRFRELRAQHTRLRRAEGLSARLRDQARHDLLTGLANRAAFENRLARHLEPARAQDSMHVLAFLDVNQLHAVNESRGHVAGDALLRHVADTLSAHQRDGDLLARVAGDQFAWLLLDTPMHEARRLIGAAHAALGAAGFRWGDARFDVGASVGVVPVDGRHADVTALLSAAETACNVAKDHGHNRIHEAGPSDRESTERLSEAQRLPVITRALDEGRFRLFFQTIVPLRAAEDGEHYEVLVRMLDDAGGLVPPAHFLPVVEHFHLSPRLDRWVIGAAVEWLAARPERIQRTALCAINLSGHSLGDPDVLAHVRATFAGTAVPPGKVCFEVTETAAIARLDEAQAFMDALRAQGFRFALDDFGSGLASFAYLKTLPVDFLKIDGMFVRNMHRDAVDQAVVKAIAEIGKAMGKRTIAEFVENAEILDHLRALDVDYAQGYHLAVPRPLDESGG